jgi:TetR/AcrR family transcriptional repressor of nem operon
MKVTRAQAQENRRAVIEVAGRLFREYGFDGVGLNQLMGAVGLTQGGFYKQFESKDDLTVRACERVLTESAKKLSNLVESSGEHALTATVTRYLSWEHRNRVAEGCIFPALGPDAARRGSPILHSFERGITSYMEILERAMRASLPQEKHREPAVMLSIMVGALLLSRLVEEETLAKRILDAAVSDLVSR